MRPPAGAVRVADLGAAYCKGEADEASLFLDMDVLPPADPTDRGITTFEAQGSSRDETLALVLEAVDEHHGEHAHSPPWTALEIYGLDEVDAGQVGFQEYGVTQIIRTAFGLEARRPPPPTRPRSA